jgi:GNAT superfamily N-acetyltransferase
VLHDLRRRVLRSANPDASVEDDRDEEATSCHFAGLLGERVVVSASFYPSTLSLHRELVTYQLRYMATDAHVQGRGYGARVLRFAEQDLASRGVEQLWANGRDSALGFYVAMGWSTIPGSEHVSSETKLPHTVIYKVL